MCCFLSFGMGASLLSIFDAFLNGFLAFKATRHLHAFFTGFAHFPTFRKLLQEADPVLQHGHQISAEVVPSGALPLGRAVTHLKQFEWNLMTSL